MALCLLDERPRIRWQSGSPVCLRFEIELGLEFREGQLLAGVLGGQADHDVAQLTHVAGKVIVAPGLLRRVVQRERRGAPSAPRWIWVGWWRGAGAVRAFSQRRCPPPGRTI